MDGCILAINGGSSSIKFALFQAVGLNPVLRGSIEKIGLPGATLRVEGLRAADRVSRAVRAPDQLAAIGVLVDAIDPVLDVRGLVGVGHRIVHGGANYAEPQAADAVMIEALRGLSAFDPEHLPQEIGLIEAFQRRFPEVPQVACFDTAFHHDLPRVARLLPIPRRYEAEGVRRYGFHGLSCTFLMSELARLDGVDAADGRVILAHLGNGASITAVRGGRSIDTSMSFTPAAGLPMSTRSGDLDPGLAPYLARTENMSPGEFGEMINFRSGLLGISETSSDMSELLDLEATDERAAEAVAIFCYQARKWIGAFAAALGGLDTLIFAGGIGENASAVRERICENLAFLGLELDRTRNGEPAALLSADTSRVKVRMVRTNEEVVIARAVAHVLDARRAP